jgi:DNA-binding NtrC family response regulator
MKELPRIVAPGWRIEPLPLDDQPIRLDRILARAKVMKQVLNRLLAAARSQLPVLILGETGTGKELAAESIHLRSRRNQGPFVALNASAIPRELVASELFGHEAGAFTGATKTRPGKLARAHRGTLFLDEVDSMEMGTQSALLRFLEDGVFEPVGGDRPRHVDVRVIAATNCDLEERVAQGRFRQDLYWRLAGFILKLPPLRERTGGILMLAREILRELDHVQGLAVRGFSRDAEALLEAYPWPGNVRELRHVVQSSALLAQGRMIGPEDLPERFFGPPLSDPEFRYPGGRKLAALQRAYIEHALALCQGNKSAAAQRLGISRKALYAALRRPPPR